MERKFGYRQLLFVGLLLILAFALAGCGGGGSKSGSAVAYLTDASSGLFDHVYITVDSVQINTSNGWVTISNSLGKVDLLSPQFQFHQQLMGSAPLPAGHYGQTRLVLSSAPDANQVVLKGETSPRNLEIPSGAQTGLKLIGEFDIAPGESQAIIVDFAPDKMIHPAANGTKFILRPTCPLITANSAPESYGGLIGKVQPNAAWPTAVVTAYQSGTDTVVAATTVTQGDPQNPSDTDGSFRMALPAGTYTLKVTADGYQTYDSSTGTPPSWAVSVGADMDAGIITLSPNQSQ